MKDQLLVNKKKSLNTDKNEEHTNYIFDHSSNFSLHTLNKGETFNIRNKNKNCIVFIISGEIELTRENDPQLIFEKESMFFVSANNFLYSGSALQNAKIILLRIIDILPFYEKLSLNDLEIYCPSEVVELEAIGIEEHLYYFLHGIILYLRNNIQCIHLHNLKKNEFFFIIRTFYEKKIVARFLSPLIQSQNDFRNMVLNRHTPTCSVEELASRCNMSAKTLTRKFKEHFNTTPYQWLMLQKNKLIKIKLAQGESVQKIADEFDFPSVGHFVSYCKKYIE